MTFVCRIRSDTVARCALPEEDALIVVEKTERAVEWRGRPRFFRGHRIAGSHAERPDGIYAEWRWDGRELIVTNDRYGVSPLFYAAHRNWLAVSPSIATLLAKNQCEHLRSSSRRASTTDLTGVVDLDLSLRSKRNSESQYHQVIDIRSFCAANPEYAMLRHNRWILPSALAPLP